MSVDPAKFRKYTDEELLTIYRAGIAALGTGQSYAINGRQMTRVDLDKMMKMVTWLESRIDTATGDGDVGVVVFDDPAAHGERRFDRRRF